MNAQWSLRRHAVRPYQNPVAVALFVAQATRRERRPVRKFHGVLLQSRHTTSTVAYSLGIAELVVAAVGQSLIPAPNRSAIT